MSDRRWVPNGYQSQPAEDDPLDFSDLTGHIEQAPTDWLRTTIEHLSMLQRADVMRRAPDWHLAVIHEQSDRAMDVLLAELGRRIAADAA